MNNTNRFYRFFFALLITGVIFLIVPVSFWVSFISDGGPIILFAWAFYLGFFLLPLIAFYFISTNLYPCLRKSSCLFWYGLLTPLSFIISALALILFSWLFPNTSFAKDNNVGWFLGFWLLITIPAALISTPFSIRKLLKHIAEERT